MKKKMIKIIIVTILAVSLWQCVNYAKYIIQKNIIVSITCQKQEKVIWNSLTMEVISNIIKAMKMVIIHTRGKRKIYVTTSYIIGTDFM